MAQDPCRVVTGKARSTYMQVTKLEQRGDEITPETPKTASVCILIPKRDKATVRKLRKAIEAASKKKFGKVVVKEGRDGYPLHDGDEALEAGDKTGKEYEKHYYVNARTYEKLPGLVDADGDLIEDPEERADICVSGYYFKFSLTFKGYERSGKKVRCELNNIMFVEEGERLDGGVSADQESWGDEDDNEEELDEEELDEEDEAPSRRSKRSSSRSSRRSRRD